VTAATDPALEMKSTNALYMGNEPGWVLQSRGQEPGGRPTAHWADLESNKGLPGPNPHMHTYGHTAEKWDSSGRSFCEQRPLLGRGPAGPPSRRWGIGGDTPSGKASVAPLPPQDPRASSKRINGPNVSGTTYGLERQMPRKGHVFNAAGVDVRAAKSAEFGLADVMARKMSVSEEARTAHRTIDRMAPAGLKGYIGAEYSNGYYNLDGVVVRQKLCPSKADLQLMELEAALARAARLGVTKSFSQKKKAAELDAEVELVSTLDIPYETLSDDEEAERVIVEE